LRGESVFICGPSTLEAEEEREKRRIKRKIKIRKRIRSKIKSKIRKRDLIAPRTKDWLSYSYSESCS